MLRRLPRIRIHLVVLAALFTALAAVDVATVFRPAHNALVDARMRGFPIEASGDIVYVAIDSRSLDALGVWPWPRQVHARIIDSVFAAGAAELFLDVDLSARSTEAADAALANAIADATGTVILPMFLARQQFGTEAVASNLPLPEFRDGAWLAAINLSADPDGRVRNYPYGLTVDGEWIPSAAALMSGVFGTPGSTFAINYAIRPDTAPTTSVIDIVRGASGLDLRGKSVIVGAEAVELRDAVSVPVYGILSGAQIRLLASETLVQNVALRRINRWPAIVVVGLGAVLLGWQSRGSVPRMLFCLIGLAIMVEVVALWLHVQHAIVLSTPVLLAMLFVSKIVFAGRELGLRSWLAHRHLIAQGNVERILDQVIDDSSDAILIAADDMRPLRISNSARALFEMPPGDDLGTLDEIVPADVVAACRDAIASVDDHSAAATVARELSFARDGEIRCIEYSVTPSRLRGIERGPERTASQVVVSIVARDVTLDRAQRMALDRLARFDALTGALNRSELLERLAAHLADGGRGAAVLAFDVRRLRTINETLGRSMADALLVAMVRRVDATQLPVSPVGRLGGDRFAVFTLGAASATDAECVADALAHAARAPFHLGEHTVRSGIRVGIAPGRDTIDAEMMLLEAEHALDECRFRSGADRCVFNRATFERQARARRIERAQWTSIAGHEVFVFLQPQVRMSDGGLIGAEALSRWTHPAMGAISPGEFIPIAESSGFIDLLGQWVLREACRCAATWARELSIAVNVSPLQFRRTDLAGEVAQALDATGLEPSRLCLEITESVFVDSGPEVLLTLWRLREMGVLLALDDFGSGFSSLGYLARLPINKLKLDQVFARGLANAPYHEAVIRSVVPLCRELGVTLLVEGVEGAAEARRLRELGSVEAQGYHYGRPMPEADFLDLVGRVPAAAGAGV
jgi:diguanylate cyclase (GGDEF)-like protein